MGRLASLADASTRAHAGWPESDGPLAPTYRRRPARHVPRQGVLEVAGVVALGATRVETLVGAARLAPGERGMRHRPRHVELVSQLEKRQPLGIPSLGVIG